MVAYTKVVLWYDIYIYIYTYICIYIYSTFHTFPSLVQLQPLPRHRYGYKYYPELPDGTWEGDLDFTCQPPLQKTFQIFQIAGGDFLEADGGCLSFRVKNQVSIVSNDLFQLYCLILFASWQAQVFYSAQTSSSLIPGQLWPYLSDSEDDYSSPCANQLPHPSLPHYHGGGDWKRYTLLRFNLSPSNFVENVYPIMKVRRFTGKSFPL